MIFTGRRRMLLLMAVLALFGVLVVTTEQTEGSGRPQDRVVYHAPEGPITHGEIVNGRSDLFTSDIRRTLGGRLATVWVSDDIVYNVGIVSPTEADRALVTERARVYGATGVVVPMKYRPAYLGRLLDAVGEVMVANHVICSADVDEPTNKLEVVLAKHDKRVIAELKRIVPPDILVLVVAKRDCYLDLFVGKPGNKSEG